MKTSVRSIVVGLICLLLSSCNHVFKEYDRKSFPTYSWKDGQVIEFHPRIEDETAAYALRLGIRYHYGLELESFDVSVRTIAPSGKEMVKKVSFQVRDEKNEHVGDCAGDICDREIVVVEKHIFEEAGEYKVLVTHGENGYRIPGIMEVGVIIDKSE